MNMGRVKSIVALFALAVFTSVWHFRSPLYADETANSKVAGKEVAANAIPDSKQAGGEPDGVVQVANLVYAGTKSSKCFSDHFLIQAEKDSAISTSRRFHAVKLESDDIYDFPLLIMTGEGNFTLSDAERQSLRRYVERGGLLLASAGCSSKDWDSSFRKEMVEVFPENSLAAIGMDHPMFKTVYDIKHVESGGKKQLEGISLEGRLGVIYSEDGLNDSHSTPGCCCCGGSEIKNAVKINVNILAYALAY
jgi:hypothetical protein